MGIKLEAGKRYVSRGGHVYGPLYAVKSSRFPFECRAASERWTPDGDYHDDGEECICDLIALAPDEAPEPQPDELAALRARVAELQQEIAAIRREAETNQKWAFLEWRDRAGRADAENARLREALMEAKRVIESDPPSIVDTVWCVTGGSPETLLDRIDTALTAKEPAR